MFRKISSAPIEGVFNATFEVSVKEYFALEEEEAHKVREAIRRKGFVDCGFVHTVHPLVMANVETLIFKHGFRPERIPMERVTYLIRQYIDGYSDDPYLLSKESYNWLKKHQFQIDETQIYCIGRDEVHMVDKLKDDV